MFNVVHGGREAVEAICDHPGIAAITFVGSTAVAKQVYRRGTASLKRVLALGGAKNHLIVLPDADPEMAAGGVLASMSGCTGQRCMAASVMLAVSATDHVVDAARGARRSAMVAGPGRGARHHGGGQGADRARHHRGGAGGRARCWSTARRAVVPGRRAASTSGPTVLDQVRPEMRIAQEEVFGPVLAIVRARDLDEALAVENASPYGNAASVFTESGGSRRTSMPSARARA